MAEPARYIVAGYRPWAREVFDRALAARPGTWHYVASPEDLTPELVETLRPRFIFFLHWSWLVPREIHEHHECVCFHMTDLPYGRGGSPLQNLIVRGHASTTLTALRMTAELDAGPVYAKRVLGLDGPAHAIYRRASELAAEMIGAIIEHQPDPQPQVGEPVVFERRHPEQSRLPAHLDARRLYDFIRMLDADGYPRAFLETLGYRLELEAAELRDGHLRATVSIRKTSDTTEGDG